MCLQGSGGREAAWGDPHRRGGYPARIPHPVSRAQMPFSKV